MPGGGSKPGERRGGRTKGTPNKATAARQADIAASGLTPLEYMLNILRDENMPPERRDDMAKAAAPYVHPKLSSVDMSADVRTMTHEEWIDQLDDSRNASSHVT